MSPKASISSAASNVNKRQGWNIVEFADIKNYLADRRSITDILEFNWLINSLHLCDPAVGSGHIIGL